MVSPSIQNARVLGMHWLDYIGSYLWEEMTQALE